MDKIRYVLLAGAFCLGSVLAARPAAAASTAAFELATPSVNVQRGQSVAVEVRIDSAGQNMNAAEIVVKYNPAVFRVERVAKEQSIFTLWPQEPIVDQGLGTITMTGGRPGGLYASHSTVATVYLRAEANGLGEILVDPAGSSLAANDGAGTRLVATGTRLEIPVGDSREAIVLSSPTHPDETAWSRQHDIVVHWTAQSGASYSYLLTADPQAVVDEIPELQIGDATFSELHDGVYYFLIKMRGADGTWSAISARRFLIDSTPPEPFTIIHPNPRDVGGRDMVTWTATDVTSGVSRNTAKIDGRDIGTVSSPLALRSAWRGHRLIVTAFDATGNSRRAAWTGGARAQNQRWLFAVIGGLVVGLAGGLWFLRRRA